MNEPLTNRRSLLEHELLPKVSEPIRYSLELKASLPDLIASVKSAGLEGLVAKRREQSLRAGTTLWRLAENENQSRGRNS